MRVNKINFHFFRLHGYVLRFVMYIVKLGTSWYWVRHGLDTSWSGYELVLGTSWLGYELAWYDLVRVRVDWKPVNCVIILYFMTLISLTCRLAVVTNFDSQNIGCFS